MAAITPKTDVYLLKVPLEIDNENQLTFANATAQFNYFNGLTGKIALDNFTYQRKDGVIRVPYNIDDIINYNYVMYRNEGFSNKWFYAYITGMEFVNPNTTAVSIKTDVFQTWQFDLTYKQTFVEREHVNDDTIGANTIDEGLEIGEYVSNGLTNIFPHKIVKDKNNNTISGLSECIVFQVTELVSGLSIASTMFDDAYNGVFSGLYYFAVTTYNNARLIISRYDNAGKGDSIIAIFQAPTSFLAGANVFGELGYNIYIPSSGNLLLPSQLQDDTTITTPTTVDTYTPKNNKLFTYPFSYLYVSNNAGIDTDFRYEDFTNATPIFDIVGALGQGCTVKLRPKNYKKITNYAFEYSVTGAKYPICAWASDYYTNWCTQNAINMGLSLVQGGLSAAGNMMFGNVVGATGSLLSSIGGVMAQRYQAKVHPDQAKGNTNSSDILICASKYFSVLKMSVRAEVARSIDEFFSMFGYKVNRVKIPNVTGRTNWNYVKTVGCYIDADIPQEDLQEIKNLFDKGITFWHNASHFRDYSQSNGIVTP